MFSHIGHDHDFIESDKSPSCEANECSNHQMSDGNAEGIEEIIGEDHDFIESDKSPSCEPNECSNHQMSDGNAEGIEEIAPADKVFLNCSDISNEKQNQFIVKNTISHSPQSIPASVTNTITKKTNASGASGLNSQEETGRISCIDQFIKESTQSFLYQSFTMKSSIEDLCVKSIKNCFLVSKVIFNDFL